MKHKEHHKREALLLISLLLLFGIVFMLGIINLKRGTSVFGIMMAYVIEDWVVIALSFLAVIRVFYEIVRV